MVSGDVVESVQTELPLSHQAAVSVWFDMIEVTRCLMRPFWQPFC